MTTYGEEQDQRISEMLQVVADALVEEMPEIGFVLILGRSSSDQEEGSLISLSNLDDDNTAHILEMVLIRRKALADRKHTTTKTVQ